VIGNNKHNIWHAEIASYRFVLPGSIRLYIILMQFRDID